MFGCWLGSPHHKVFHGAAGTGWNQKAITGEGWIWSQTCFVKWKHWVRCSEGGMDRDSSKIKGCLSISKGLVQLVRWMYVPSALVLIRLVVLKVQDGLLNWVLDLSEKQVRLCSCFRAIVKMGCWCHWCILLLFRKDLCNELVPLCQTALVLSRMDKLSEKLCLMIWKFVYL